MLLSMFSVGNQIIDLSAEFSIHVTGLHRTNQDAFLLRFEMHASLNVELLQILVGHLEATGRVQ